MAGLFSRLQVRYRSDRFGRVGKRFGVIEYDPREQVELEIGRMRDADDMRRNGLRRALESAIKSVD